jgi:hypothetical protein
MPAKCLQNACKKCLQNLPLYGGIDTIREFVHRIVATKMKNAQNVARQHQNQQQSV